MVRWTYLGLGADFVVVGATVYSTTFIWVVGQACLGLGVVFVLGGEVWG